ncbi:hypothetical protein [Micromonospora zhanjiangensis]|uniref:4-amino-4-deoxy-L-arabinose transferase n=1 Tax=Micromonospora zhanjiangensis TaxID=1522057 RepID=A0ABV8KKY2_9ACTN
MTTDQSSNPQNTGAAAAATSAVDGSPDTPGSPQGEAGPNGTAPTKNAGPTKDDHATSKDGATATNGTASKDSVGSTSREAKSDEVKSDKAEAEASDVAEADPWDAFASAPEERIGRPRRILRATGRALVHEWTLAALASLVLAVLMTWPTLRYPLHTIPQDYWDPTLQAWQMAWSGHALLTDPAHLFQSNTFYPEKWSFAFSDMLLGYAPAGMIGSGPQAALLRYNIIFVLAHAVATFGAYALVRQLGAGRIGAAVAGVGYAYAPWLLSQAGHLHIVSNGGIPLALAMLARGHGWSMRHGYRPDRRHAGWALAGWLVASWQITLGFGIGLPFAYILGLLVPVTVLTWYARRLFVWRAKRPFGWRLLLADLAGGLVFAATGALLAIPFFKVAELHPYAKRSVGDLEVFSPPAGSFLIAPAESRIWGSLHEPARATLTAQAEMTLLPGYVLYALAIAGLFFSIWTVRQRLLLLAGTVLIFLLSMGTEFFGGRYTYLPLYDHLPGWEGLRTPGRLMLWGTLLLCVLAAGSVSALADRAQQLAAQRIPSWPGPWLRLATLVPLLLVLVEGLNATPHPVVPQQPAALRTADGPLLVLPSDQGTDQNVMLWSTTRFQPVVNGGSGFLPTGLAKTRQAAESFPDRASVDYLRGIGVKTVVVLRDRVAGTPWEASVDLPVEPLGIQREDVGDVVVYRL